MWQNLEQILNIVVHHGNPIFVYLAGFLFAQNNAYYAGLGRSDCIIIFNLNIKFPYCIGN